MDMDHLLKIIHLEIKIALINSKIFILRNQKKSAIALYLVFLAGSLFVNYRLITGNFSNLILLMGIQSIAGVPLVIFFWYTRLKKDQKRT